MFRRKRLTNHYVIEQHGDKVFVSHNPLTILYFVDREKFFRERVRAYRILANKLKDRSFWGNATSVYSQSLTIDFSREVAAESVSTKWHDKPGLLYLWLTNVYNWRPKRLLKVKKYLETKRASKFHVDRSTFIRVYCEGGEEHWSS